jgi:hypothetical protein
MGFLSEHSEQDRSIGGVLLATKPTDDRFDTGMFDGIRTSTVMKVALPAQGGPRTEDPVSHTGATA